MVPQSTQIFCKGSNVTRNVHKQAKQGDAQKHAKYAWKTGKTQRSVSPHIGERVAIEFGKSLWTEVNGFFVVQYYIALASGFLPM